MERQLRERLPGGKFGYVAPRHSRLMKQVRGKGNRTTERRFRAALVSAGISGWHTNVRGVKGSPDFYFPEERLAVFIDGCFWHGCKLCGHIPEKNRPFWEAKINRTRERDRCNTLLLRRQGISVLRFWEHEVGHSLAACVEKTRSRLTYRKRKLARGHEASR